MAELGYEELFDSDGICVVEWSERADGLLPDQRIDVEIAHAGGDRRTFHMNNRDIELPEDWTGQVFHLLAQFREA